MWSLTNDIAPGAYLGGHSAMLGWSEKNFSGNRKKCSQIRPDGQKLVKKLVLVGCPHFPACYPPNYYRKR